MEKNSLYLDPRKVIIKSLKEKDRSIKNKNKLNFSQGRIEINSTDAYFFIDGNRLFHNIHQQ